MRVKAGASQSRLFTYARTVVEETVEIRGTKWNDFNGNCLRDAGDPGLAGVTVYLDGNNNGVLDTGELSAVTLADDPATANANEAGQYRLTGLPAGSYTVREVVPAGSTQAFPTGGAHTVALTAGQTVQGIDFGNRLSQCQFRDIAEL